MKPYCQSCSMPLDGDEVLGTEKDGSRNQDYCKYCYQEGAFTAPDMSLREMETLVRNKMEEMNIPAETITMAVTSLPELKRWKKKSGHYIIL
ncbi:MAG: zinc ribbon domain-containing protein [Bacteroidota bacterium]|nr:zinc ribbon domain-containing protein [Bacteroidota bacterium]MDP4217378.1 zinc ribbon domain-containing protein [Bacteroidota bacterium]MDP4245019.1 zinc ribbon domain-containing protein [Bacteroidota bacterium]MDP4252854.1 zinc ribbon domain-containing protein [Bacteroidota bacterium]MDP4259846.1 zinc ribbon domain-containing protein [Bacteroidota bacterium]